MSALPAGEPLVRVSRGDLVESVHEIAACALDAAGNIVYSAGSIDVPFYLRSTAKPFIAAAALAAGVRERFHLEPQEIAVMAASHTGEPFHIAAVRSILQKTGLSESALQCGAHAPYNGAAAQALQESGTVPTAVYNNCSGKHAGILALCRAIGADTATYLAPQNAAQQTILAMCARLSDERPQRMPIGVDGCGIPVYAVPLRNAALSFMRFATLNGIAGGDARALRAVRDAMIAYPQYVSGTGEFDTELMLAANGAVACKAGAEGVHGVAVLGRGGLVVKVLDGTSRGRAPAVVGILRRLNWLEPAALASLAPFERPQLFNRSGTHVGEISALV
ncbi:MAG: asparaginase [Candidatus Baltobacteraceae bacterium]